MTIHFKPSGRLLAVLVSAALVAGPVLAGEGHGDKHWDKADKHAEKADKHAEKRAEKAWKHAEKQGRHGDVRVGAYFDEHDREAARTYYSQYYGHGRKCPPGLAKKHNGCMPPGQAKKWAVGAPLPAGVVVYPVPQPVLVQLPPAPYGYRYARVGNDIVLVQARNNLVIDIIVNVLG